MFCNVKSKATARVGFLLIILSLFSLLSSGISGGELVNPFLKDGQWYKAAFHSHSTTSDGKVEFAVRVDQYKKKGFDIVAVTDHWKMNDVNGMSSGDFLVLTGMEAHPDSNAEMANHLICLNMPADFNLPKETPVQELVNKVNESGGVVIYAHPNWLGHNINDMKEFGGYSAIEVYNSAVDLGRGRGYSNIHWDQLLNAGIIVGAVAVDDVHKAEEKYVGLAGRLSRRTR